MKTYSVERNLAGNVTVYATGLTYALALALKLSLLADGGIHAYVKKEF
jgi:hypothetical protein